MPQKRKLDQEHNNSHPQPTSGHSEFLALVRSAAFKEANLPLPDEIVYPLKKEDRGPADEAPPIAEDLDTDKLIEQIKRIQNFESLDGDQKLLVEKFTQPLIEALGTSEAPRALWVDRPQGRATNPVQWILEHHADVLETKGARIKIGQRDPKLIQAYATWIRRHPEDNLNLDTQQRTDLSKVSPEEALDHVRQQKRTATKKSRATRFVT